MRKESVAQLEKSNLFCDVKKEKLKALKALAKAKEVESEKLKRGYKYVTSSDGKTKTLTKC